MKWLTVFMSVGRKAHPNKKFIIGSLLFSILMFSSSVHANLITNGTFDGDWTAWETTPGLGYVTQTDGVMLFNGEGLPPNGYAAQNFSTNVGQEYLVEFNYAALDDGTTQEEYTLGVRGFIQEPYIFPAIVDLELHATTAGSD